jgi:hypothetical protein
MPERVPTKVRPTCFALRRNDTILDANVLASVCHSRTRMRRPGNVPRDKVTISDVARRVGVATSTVSRALTRPGRVSEGLRERVIAAVAELG